MKKAFSLFFALYILLLPWQSIYLFREISIDGEKWHYGTIGIYPSTIIALILIGTLIIGKIIHKIPLTKIDHPTLFIGIFFIGFSALSSFWTHDQSIALYNTAIFLLGFLLYLFLPRGVVSFKTATILLLIGASLHSLIALTQFLTQSIDPQTLLNISAHLSESGATATITDTTGRWLRAYGGMTHPNILGGFLILSTLLGMHAYIQTQKSHATTRTALLIGMSLCFIGLVITFSRSAWIAFIIGLIITAILLWHRRQSFFNKIQIPLIAFMSIALLFLISFPDLFFTRSIENTSLEHNSLSDRALYIDHAKHLVRNAPLIGVGYGNMTIISYEESIDPLKQIWQYQPVHNVFLLILTELGIIGFILFIALLSVVMHKIWKISENHPRTHAFFASICIALLTLALLDHWLITTHFGVLFFWLLMTLYKNIHTLKLSYEE